MNIEQSMKLALVKSVKFFVIQPQLRGDNVSNMDFLTLTRRRENLGAAYIRYVSTGSAAMTKSASKKTVAPRLAEGLLFVLIWMGCSAPALAVVSEITNYIKQYQVGIDYSNSIDHVNLTYETSSENGIPQSCGELEGDRTKMRCGVGMFGGSSNGWGVFLQKAFKKKGFYYWDYDLSFGARYLNGELPAKERSLDGLPLRTASFSLGALVAKPYVQFGITPDRWPDILISMGPALQVAAGTMSINDKSENVAFGTSSVTGPMSLIRGFLAIELVLRRFGDGAFSLMASHDVTGNGRGSKIYPKDVDGMSNFRGIFNRNVGGMAFGFGLKLVTPWP